MWKVSGLFLDWFFVYGVSECFSFINLHAVFMFSKTTCWRDSLFSIVYPCMLCQRLSDHRCVGLFLGSLFCFIHLYVFFFFLYKYYTIWLLWLYSAVSSLGELCLLFSPPQYFVGNSESYMVLYKVLDYFLQLCERYA